MYRKIVQHRDEKHFGTTTTIYKGADNYLVITDGRDGRMHFFVDLHLARLYPIKLDISINTEDATLDYSCDTDLQKCGFSKCPEWIYSLISEENRDS